MLIAAIALYMIATVAVGLYASRRVHGAKDFMVAGRSLPLYMNFACVFATWFGAETLLSVSATFTQDGLSGVSGDPFGASICLILVAAFFAKAFYRYDLLTIGDFYHKRYGKLVEVLTSVAITASYLGWTSAQLTALGLVIYVLGGDYFSLTQAILIGAIIVSLYTIFGGMWSVALTDLIQTVAIVLGLLVVAYIFSGQAGGVWKVISHASEAGKLRIFPEGGVREWFAFLGAFLTMGLGSIPQQDVFQRVTSAKDEKTAIRGTLMGGGFYFLFAFVPMFIAYSAIVIDPSYQELFQDDDARHIQRIIPELILARTDVWVQVLFFGALLSAILSTASGTLLAPSSIFTENVIQPFFPHFSDKHLLWILRIVLVLFAVAATIFAVNSKSTMYQMVEQAYKVTLVAAFVPLVMGIYWKRATTQGALFASILGLAVWILFEQILPEDSESPYAIVPPQLIGLAASFIGMFVGALLPQWIEPVEGDEQTIARKTRVSLGGH